MTKHLFLTLTLIFAQDLAIANAEMAQKSLFRHGIPMENWMNADFSKAPVARMCPPCEGGPFRVAKRGSGTLLKSQMAGWTPTAL